MWSKIGFSAFILLSILFGEINTGNFFNSNNYFGFNGLPVQLETNFAVPTNRAMIQKHVDDVLTPLLPFIQGDGTTNGQTGLALRRDDVETELVHLYEYQYDRLDAAQIGPYTFS